MEDGAIKIVVLPGDGIGPEVTTQAQRVLARAAQTHGISLVFEDALIGGASIDAHETPLTDEVIELCRQSCAVLLGAVGGPKWDDMSIDSRPEKGLLRIRKALGLFANLRPASVFPALVGASSLRPEIVEGIDMLVVRELTGGLYFGEPRGIKREDGKRVGFNTMIYSDFEIERIARIGFESAMRRRKQLCHMHKANVLDVSQLWMEVVEEVSKDFPEVELDHQLVDSGAMFLVKEPRRFDVIVTGNMFGDIISDEAAMVTGSLGMLPSASLGNGGVGLYEPVHGTAPDIAGRDIANPLAAILSGAMLLEHSLDAPVAAASIRQAVEKVLDDGYRSADLILAGEDTTPTGCIAMGDLVLERLESAA